MDIERIPDSELDLMHVLWEHKAPVSRVVLEEGMTEIKPLAQTTILTLVSRLVKKGYVKAEKNGRSSEYTPLVSKTEYLAAQSRRFIEKECGSKMSTFASALVQSGLSKDDIEELSELLKSGKL